MTMNKILQIILVIAAFGSGVYYALLTFHMHHFPWPSAVITMALLMLAHYFIFKGRDKRFFWAKKRTQV
jgi:hypothetical protein